MSKVTPRRVGAVLVLAAKGDFMLDEPSRMLEQALAAATVRDRCILLDLAGARSMGSQSVGVLIKAVLEHGRRGGVLKVCGLVRRPGPGFIVIFRSVISPETIYLPVEAALETFAGTDCSPLPDNE